MILISVKQLAFLYTIPHRLGACILKRVFLYLLLFLTKIRMYLVYSYPPGEATTKVISSRFFLSRVITIWRVQWDSGFLVPHSLSSSFSPVSTWVECNYILFSKGFCNRLMRSVTDDYRAGMCVRDSRENPSIKNEKVHSVWCNTAEPLIWILLCWRYLIFSSNSILWSMWFHRERANTELSMRGIRSGCRKQDS